MRTPVAAPLLTQRPELLGLDRRSAATARLTRPLEHVGALVGPQVAGRRLLRPPAVRVQQLLSALYHPTEVATWPTGVRGWMPCRKQQLGAIERADPGQIALVEQRLADGALGLTGRFGAPPRRGPSPGPSRSGPRCPTTRVLVGGGEPARSPAADSRLRHDPWWPAPPGPAKSGPPVHLRPVRKIRQVPSIRKCVCRVNSLASRNS